MTNEFYVTNPLGPFLEEARSEIVILGTNALSPWLEQSADWFSNFLITYPKLKLTILYESDSENFNQAVCMDDSASASNPTYTELTVHRDRLCGTQSNPGLLREICDKIEDDLLRDDVEKRIRIRQVNLRSPVNVILADTRAWYCLSMHKEANLDSYMEVGETTPLHRDLVSWIDRLLSPESGEVFLSKPNEELIWVYDKDGIARGIFPRAAFYTTEFRRYSVWGLVFNRKGELLLQRRSFQTRDNTGLWDKSIGGHVDLGDASTSVTAKRELVEEMFLPEAEFTKYLRADLGDIIDFGEWNPRKRPERYFRDAFEALGPSDWVLFRATDSGGAPLTITRVSERRLLDGDGGRHTTRKTVFMSDVYFFVAPDGYLDTQDQMRSLVEMAEKKGAASDHRLISIADLRSWIASEERADNSAETFTDDLLSINIEYRPLLEQFAEFVKYVF